MNPGIQNLIFWGSQKKIELIAGFLFIYMLNLI